MSAEEGSAAGPASDRHDAWPGEGAPAASPPPRPLRVGIINIMPRAESYEPLLRRPLAGSSSAVELAWIRLESHTYSSSDGAHIARSYRAFDQTIAGGALNGLILTGAPVEELPYDQITYWDELTGILAYARRAIRSTLGLCWGGMALAKQIGIEKRSLPRKLFGVFENRRLAPEGGLLGSGERFWCAQSRHSGIANDVLERARDEGVVRLLSHAADTGYTIFETTDQRYVMHLGHPEYEPERLIEEWRRDERLGRPDVDPPRHLDLEAPVNVWWPHRAALFAGWLAALRDPVQPQASAYVTTR